MKIPSPAAPGKSPRILLVDPNRTNLAVMARRLAEQGYCVTTADSGSMAIAELHRLPIDIVLAELNMPGMSGAELARAIQSQVRWNDIPLVLITAKSEPKGAARAYEAGADDVILKPFHFEVLFARLNRRLERARLLQRLKDDNAALDARVVERAMQIGELREKLQEARAKAV